MENKEKESILYKGTLLNQSVLQDLPDEVKQWLDYYNSLPPEIKAMVNFEPHELTQKITGGLTVNTPATVRVAGSDLTPPKVMYNPAGLPHFDPDYWNDPIRIKKANCYAHAMNVIVANDGEQLQPGEITNAYVDLRGTDIKGATDAIRENAISDATSGVFAGIENLQICNATDKPEDNQYKVALVAAPYADNNFFDYHWYKQQDNGSWSHKPGDTDAVEVDAADHLIGGANTPCACNRNYGEVDHVILNYSLFVNYLMVTHN